MDTTFDRDPGDETDTRSPIQRAIERLEAMPKQGASYDDKGRHGFRNPIRADTGPILRTLVLAANPKRVLEFGTAHGLSLCYIASAARKDVDLHSIEWDLQTALEAQATLNEAGLSAVVHCGDAMKVLDDLQGQFDFVFFDANKDGYAEQFEKMLERGMFHPDGCVIVADNVIDRQKECQGFLDLMQDYSHEILKTECGLLVARI